MTRRRSTASRSAALLLLAAIVAMPNLAHAVDKIFVKIDGIEGDATEIGRSGWIEALAVGNSVSVPEATGATFSNISILKRIDSATPKLFVEAASGRGIADVRIDFTTDGIGLGYFHISLQAVKITGVRTNANATGNSITEFVTLTYRKICWNYTGVSHPPPEECWDLGPN